MILFVDDEQGRMQSWIDELQLCGYSVCAVSTADEALRQLESHKNLIDLVVLDIMMPSGEKLANADTEGGLRTGMKIYEELRRVAPTLRVFVFTNVSDPFVAEKFNHESYCRFLRKKDYLPPEFAEEVRKTIGT